MNAEQKYDIMIDLETLGNTPGCVLLSLGAVKFNATAGIVSKFYMRIDPKSCEEAGLKIDPDTVMWWMAQNEEARKEVCREGSLLTEVLLCFEQWAKHTGERKMLDEKGNLLVNVVPADHVTWSGIIWSNGASADLTWLAAACRACGWKPCWNYFDERCFRTVKALTSPDFKFPMKPHHALEDAIQQAEALIQWQREKDAETGTLPSRSDLAHHVKVLKSTIDANEARIKRLTEALEAREKNPREENQRALRLDAEGKVLRLEAEAIRFREAIDRCEDLIRQKDSDLALISLDRDALKKVVVNLGVVEGRESKHDAGGVVIYSNPKTNDRAAAESLLVVIGERDAAVKQAQELLTTLEFAQAAQAAAELDRETMAAKYSRLVDSMERTVSTEAVGIPEPGPAPAKMIGQEDDLPCGLPAKLDEAA